MACACRVHEVNEHGEKCGELLAAKFFRRANVNTQKVSDEAFYMELLLHEHNVLPYFTHGTAELYSRYDDITCNIPTVITGYEHMALRPTFAPVLGPVSLCMACCLPRIRYGRKANAFMMCVQCSFCNAQ